MAARPGATASLGRAVDGGWWAIALAERWHVDVFTGVPMSTAGTADAQLTRLRECGHRVRDLPELRDVDTIDDANAVAALVPGSRFSQARSPPLRPWRADRLSGRQQPVARRDCSAVAPTGPGPAARLHVYHPSGGRRGRGAAGGPLARPGPPRGAAGPGPGPRAPSSTWAAGRAATWPPLIDAGQAALGIDVSAAAVRSARRRGAPAARVSVFADVPGDGDWATALLLDGNIGIGGEPVPLLTRVHALLTSRRYRSGRAGPTRGERGPLPRPGGARRRRRLRFAWARVGPGSDRRTRRPLRLRDRGVVERGRTLVRPAGPDRPGPGADSEGRR